MAKPEAPLGVFAHRLAEAMSLDCDAVVTLRTRPPRTVRGKVTYRRQDPGKRIDPHKRQDRSSLLVTVDGQELEVERMSDVRLVRS